MKTVIVLGDSRSGTSMVAIMLQILGIEMNPDDTPTLNPHGSFEDKEITSAIIQYYTNRTDENLTYLRNLIYKRIENDIDWGFKCALTHYIIEDIEDLFVNPYYIFTFRNIIGQSISELVRIEEYPEYKVQLDKEYIFAINRFCEVAKKYIKGQSILIKLIKKYQKYPLYIIAKEVIEHDYISAFRNFAQMLDIEITEEKLSELLKYIKTDYHSFNPYNVKIFGE